MTPAERIRLLRMTSEFRAHENALRRARRERQPERKMLEDARTRANKKGLEFNIGPEDVEIPAMCPALGIPIRRGSGVVCENSPSIDRIDPGAGYVKGNVCVISARANRIKNSATPDELIALAKYVEGFERRGNVSAT